MNRREFVRGLIASSALPSLLSVPLITAPSVASAQAMEIITAAIGVVQMLDSTNSGDGGLGANLAAINGKVDIAIQQLAAIENSMEFLISQVVQLRADLFDALGEQYAYQLYNQVLTSIEKIQDIRLEAKIKGVSLAADNHDRGDFAGRLQSAYDYFDLSRSLLRNAPAGVATVPSSICSPCLAIDSFAFACGAITDAHFAINLGHHLEWLDKIVDPSVEYSVAAYLVKARDEENDIITTASKLAEKDHDSGSIIASRLYSSSPANLCVIYTMDEIYFHDQSPKLWTHGGVSQSVLVATLVRQEINHAGATFLDNIEIKELKVAHYKPD